MASIERPPPGAETPADKLIAALQSGRQMSVLMVCMGNICRSPTAEAVLRHKLALAGLAGKVLVDSAGTHAWHRGEPPDPRSIVHARKRGYDLSGLRARPVGQADFELCDMILAMDWDNLSLLEEQCPPHRRTKLGRLSQFAQRFDDPVVPDPYQSGPGAFEHVLDLVEDACDGLVASLVQKSNLHNMGTS